MNNYHTVQPQYETIKIDGKNWTLEASGLITIMITIGFFILAGLYIYGKFFHVKVKEKVRRYNVRRKTKRAAKKKSKNK